MLLSALGSVPVLLSLAVGTLADVAELRTFGKSRPIKNKYIVQYKNGADSSARQEHETEIHLKATRLFKKQGIIRKFDFGGRAHGYHAELTDAQVKKLNATGLIKSIERDATITVSSPMHLARDPEAGSIRTVSSATWGQARLSHRRPQLSSSSEYVFMQATLPVDTTVYVIDSGILTTHAQFNGRASWGRNFIDSTNTDGCGHGTHVAGTVAGSSYGVAPNARVVAVKVFANDCSGSWSAVIAALDWAWQDAVGRNATNTSVINMSIGGSRSDTLNNVVTAVVQGGVTVVVAAGNENQNASNVSPASCPDAISVGSIDANDKRSGFSNWGPDVDLFAPGADITSAYVPNNDSYLRMWGTSMAAPHITGLAAYFIEVYGPHTPSKMRERLLSYATPGLVTDPAGAPNRIAFNGNSQELNRL